jgi:uncharacterized protein involved in exopolysaccharide biosynthesis
MQAAQEDLKRCLGGAIINQTTPKKKCSKLLAAEKNRDELTAQFTPEHPSVREAENAVRKAQAACDKEDPSVPTKSVSPAECVASAKRRIEYLRAKEAEIEKKKGVKPKLERQWAELNLDVTTIELEYTEFKKALRSVTRERSINANEFKESFVLVDPPRVPEIPSYPDRNQFMFIGIGVTFVIGMLLALSREAFRQTFVDAREVEEQTGLPVLSSLPSVTNES